VFKVKWIVRFQEVSPIEVEDGAHADLDELVAFLSVATFRQKAQPRFQSARRISGVR
jgi:hypothetical protein